MKIRTFILSLMVFAAFASQAQVITIKAARNLGVGATVTVRGIVTNGSELGTIRYFQDSTAGIAAYSSTLANVNRGDSIEITGTIKDYKQLLELDPVSSFTVLSTGNPLPSPEVIVPDSLNENREGELVEIHNAVFTTNPGGTFSSNTGYNFTANGQTSKIYVRSGHPLIGTVIPTGPVTLVGIASQYSYSSPTSGYQLLCRDTNDIISSSAISIISSVTLDSLSTTGFAIDWLTDNPGTSEMFWGTTALGNHMKDTNATVNHHLKISNATASQVVYVKAFSVAGTDTAFAPVRVFITQSNSSGEMKVYFNHQTDHTVSTGTDAVTLPNAIDDTLIAYINRAKSSIDFTMYNFNETGISSVSTALNNAFARGVTVRVIYDGSANNTGIQNLVAGIKKIGSPTSAGYGIMHNKFIVFDAYDNDANVPLVWTGSTNLTKGQINTDPNSVIIIQDKSLAIAYTLEFDEMFGSSSPIPSLANAKFGPDKTDNTPHEFIINGKKVECYFSPSDGTNSVILSTINRATNNINIATMLITRSDIAYALQDAVNNNNVDMKVLVDAEGSCSQTVWNILSNLLDTNLREDKKQPGIMHHKFMVIDNGQPGAAVLLGSHNWSNSANNKNDENTLVINDESIANQYFQAFKYRFDQNGPSGINSGDAFKGVKIFPNPAASMLNIEVDAAKAQKVSIEIVDITGRKVFASASGLTAGINRMSVDVTGFVQGVYFVRLISGNGIYLQKVVVK
jgi:phosphatidylserine/phosphatidylglycerophosphate/cardiolipin synthase-like enzyme